MPTYQYECDHCGHQFEILQSMRDAKLKKCPACGRQRLYRLIGTGGGIIFKGSGFYETDYKKKEPAKESSAAGSAAAAKTAGADKKENAAGKTVSDDKSGKAKANLAA